MKIIAQNQMQLAKKVDLMNKRLKNFLNEAVTTTPIDLSSLSVKEEPVEDLSEFSIEANTAKKTINTSNNVNNSGVRTITSKNADPFDPTWTSQKEAIKKEEPLPKGINRTKSMEEMFPEVVGVEEQVKQLEEQMRQMNAKAANLPPPPPRPKPPTMEELIQKNRDMQKGLVKPETPPTPEVIKPKKKRATKTKVLETVSNEES